MSVSKTLVSNAGTFYSGDTINYEIQIKNTITDIDIPTLINLDHYLYRSDKNFVSAIQYTYLTDEEEKIFEKMKE